MSFLSQVIRKVKSFGQGHEVVKWPSWDQTQVWRAPSKACRYTFHCRTGSVLSRGPEQYQRKMCKGISEKSPSDCMWTPPIHAHRDVCLGHRASMTLRPRDSPSWGSVHRDSVFCALAYALPWSFQFTREHRAKVSCQLNHNRSSLSLVREPSPRSLSFPLFCLLSATRASRLPLTTEMSLELKEKTNNSYQRLQDYRCLSL